MRREKQEDFSFITGGLYLSEDECTTVSWKGGLIVPVCFDRESLAEDDYVTVITLFGPFVSHLVMHSVEQRLTFERVA